MEGEAEGEKRGNGEEKGKIKMGREGRRDKEEDFPFHFYARGLI